MALLLKQCSVRAQLRSSCSQKPFPDFLADREWSSGLLALSLPVVLPCAVCLVQSDHFVIFYQFAKLPQLSLRDRGEEMNGEKPHTMWLIY